MRNARASYQSPQGILGAGVQQSEGGDGEALVVRPERQLCPVHGHQLCPVVVTLEGTPGAKRSPEASLGGCGWQEALLGCHLVTCCHSPMGQEGPLGLLEGADGGSGPALVQHQDQTGVGSL